MNETEQILTTFICSELLEDPGYPLARDDDLLLDEIIDSLGVMRLVEFIEQRSGERVPSSDITVENLATVEVLAAYLAARGMQLE